MTNSTNLWPDILNLVESTFRAIYVQEAAKEPFKSFDEFVLCLVNDITYRSRIITSYFNIPGTDDYAVWWISLRQLEVEGDI